MDPLKIEEEKSKGDLTFHPITNHNTKISLRKADAGRSPHRDASPVSPVRPLAMNHKHLDKERMARYKQGVLSKVNPQVTLYGPTNGPPPKQSPVTQKKPRPAATPN